MMKKEFQISNPCSENWDKMNQAPEGRFCDLCSKKVFDLRDKTDAEIHSLLKENESICGKIQSTRLNSTPEQLQTHYNFFQFPFRKIAGGVFLAAMLSSNLHAQRTKDTTRVQDIQGMVLYAIRDPDYEPDKDWKFYKPKNKNVHLEYSGNKEILKQAERVNILTLSNKYNASHDNISIPEYDLGFKNILVFENQSNDSQELNSNQLYVFSNKKNRQEETILYANLDKAKKIEFKPRKNKTLYFLDGEEISKEEYEKNRKNKAIDSYFLSEFFAEELLGKEYDLEDGIVVSYRRND